MTEDTSIVDAERRVAALMNECADLREELSVLRDTDIVGESASMLALSRSVYDAARVDDPVLITGEVGVGKTSAAAFLHNLSKRRDKRFVVVPCASLPPTLQEPTIFGFAQGAFTGRSRYVGGQCEAADGGTLFISGIDGLLPGLQVKLLHLIEHGEYPPIGAMPPLRPSVRIVAGSTRDLNALVQRGAFNEALHACLRATTIRVPPIRERAEDVLILARLFVSRLQGPLNLPDISISPDNARALLAHPWRGNVRELRCSIELAMITSTDGTTLNLQLLQ
jgi:DNA-binding NtrC family response regulator